MFAQAAFEKLLSEYEFHTVLDIGCGSGEHSRIFREHGKQVISIDYGRSVYFQTNKASESILIGDFLEFSEATDPFDCIWCSHVLEHQINVNLFLKHIDYLCKDNGILAITVPVFNGLMEGGHLTAWNAGLLLYNLVLAGFDCKEARVLTQGYDISVIVRKKVVSLPILDYDNGDITRLQDFLPDCLTENSNGTISSLNW